MAEEFGLFAGAAEEDPAAAFLAQQESEIAGIEGDPGPGSSPEPLHEDGGRRAWGRGTAGAARGRGPGPGPGGAPCPP